MTLFQQFNLVLAPLGYPPRVASPVEQPSCSVFVWRNGLDAIALVVDYDRGPSVTNSIENVVPFVLMASGIQDHTATRFFTFDTTGKIDEALVIEFLEGNEAQVTWRPGPGGRDLSGFLAVAEKQGFAIQNGQSQLVACVLEDALQCL